MYLNSRGGKNKNKTKKEKEKQTEKTTNEPTTPPKKTQKNKNKKTSKNIWPCVNCIETSETWKWIGLSYISYKKKMSWIIH